MSAQSTRFRAEMRFSFRANAGLRRRDGGVGSGRRDRARPWRRRSARPPRPHGRPGPERAESGFTTGGWRRKLFGAQARLFFRALPSRSRSRSDDFAAMLDLRAMAQRSPHAGGLRVRAGDLGLAALSPVCGSGCRLVPIARPAPGSWPPGRSAAAGVGLAPVLGRGRLGRVDSAAAASCESLVWSNSLVTVLPGACGERSAREEERREREARCDPPRWATRTFFFRAFEVMISCLRSAAPGRSEATAQPRGRACGRGSSQIFQSVVALP